MGGLTKLVATRIRFLTQEKMLKTQYTLRVKIQNISKKIKINRLFIKFTRITYSKIQNVFACLNIYENVYGQSYSEFTQ